MTVAQHAHFFVNRAPESNLTGLDPMLGLITDAVTTVSTW